MNRIRELREQFSITQKELGARIGLDDSTISLYEHEKRQIELGALKAMAEFFNVSTDYLLGRSEKKSPATETAAEEEDRFIARLKALNPEYRQRVEDFVSGLEAAHQQQPDPQD